MFHSLTHADTHNRDIVYYEFNLCEHYKWSGAKRFVMFVGYKL